jgi:hypothetical protein
MVEKKSSGNQFKNEDQKFALGVEGSTSTEEIHSQLFHNEKCVGLVSHQLSRSAGLRETEGSVQHEGIGD